MHEHHPTPTVTRTRNGRLCLTGQHQNLAANLGAIVRYAVAHTSSEQTCAALLKISVRRLRQVARDANVPLLFVAASIKTARGTRRTVHAEERP
ncbi:hypothetical protein [Nannocystis pusilla]|uniref:hypothetical protein n=1 Tax=Nannocystis pusilla TaxID=889268 RepID=UPI003BF2CCFC